MKTTQSIYLDYNATTPVDPEVAAAMKPALDSMFGNPSSQHRFGLEARKMVETARNQVAALIGCTPEEIIFTSGGTESNNHAIKGVALAHRQKGRHIITSGIEHPAVLEVCRYLQKEGFEVSYIPVDSSGRILISVLEEAIRKDTILISVMHANNETGTIQPLAEIGRLARSRGIIFHTDAAQSAGKIACNVDELGVDLLSIAGHKLYGPKGIGALYIRQGTQVEKLMHGADHEGNRRAGTENVPEIVGLGKACALAQRDLLENQEKMRQARDLLWKQVSSALPAIKWNGSAELCLPNTLSVSFPGMIAGTLLSALEGIAASAGAACHTGDQAVSHVLDAMGVDVSDAMGTIRFSTGKNTDKDEIRKAAGMIVKVVRSLGGQEERKDDMSQDPVRLTRYTHGMGCACKLRPQDLEQVLKKMPHPRDPFILINARDADDATVWKIDEEKAWVESVDFFTPVVDDPFTFGAVAAANALSDLYAMGAKPLFALNIAAFPAKRLPLSVLEEIQNGALSIAEKAAVHILGGHTIEDNELKFGLVVNGLVHPDRIMKNNGACVGDSLVLTKPLGTGILTTALKKGALGDEEYAALVKNMTTLNKGAAESITGFHVNACTDVTGFGLLGHLLEILKASHVSAEITAAKVPLLKGVSRHAANGLVPGGSLQNLSHIDPYTDWHAGISQNLRQILSDAQTSGGLLFSVPADQAGDITRALAQNDCTEAAIIGSIREKSDKYLYVV